MNYRHLYILLLSLLFACESVVEVDIPRQPAQLTANAFFTPDSVWTVALSKNRYILDNNQFEGLPQATVAVWQGEQLVTSLQYQGEDPFKGHSIYRATDAYPQAGIPYTLRVDHPDFATLTASSQVPGNAPQIIDVILDTLDVRQDDQLDTTEVAYGLTLRLDDPPEDNFYSLSLIIRWDGFGTVDVDGNGELLLKEEVEPMLIRSDDPIIDNTFDSYRGELLFKDGSFNGQQYALKTYVLFRLNSEIYTRVFNEGFVLEMNAYGSEGNIIRQAGDTVGIHTIYAILRTTTEAYYNYTYTRDLQALVESNPFAQPVQVFDNIDNGLGVFAGYNQAEQKIATR